MQVKFCKRYVLRNIRNEKKPISWKQLLRKHTLICHKLTESKIKFLK